MKKIVITGVTSFIGFHLARELSAFYEVIGTTTADHNSYSAIQKTRLDLLKNQNIKFEILDIRDHQALKQLIQIHRPDYWINHAGYTKNYASHDYNSELADSIHEAPLETLYSELAKVHCKGIIGTGTCMEYSDLDNPHSEDEECHPSTPYGKSKLKQTLKSLELGKKYNIPTSIIRVFIPFGDYDDPRKLFPTLVQKLWKNEEMPLSTGAQERNFVPIAELIHLYFLLLKYNEGQEIYNGASTLNISVKDFILKTTREQRLNQALLKFGVYPLREGEALFCTARTNKLHSFYQSNTSDKLLYIENLNEYENLKNHYGFFVCPSPKVRQKIMADGHFVFSTLPFFHPEDHFLLAGKVNNEITNLKKKLQVLSDDDLSFNIIFQSQFSIGQRVFREMIIERLTKHFNIEEVKLEIFSNDQRDKLKPFSNICSSINGLLLNRLPKLQDVIFMSAHHPLM